MLKRQFIEIMTEWKAIDDAERRCNVAFKELEPDFNFFSIGRFHSLILRVLTLAMYDTDWISYYVYELKWGADWKPGTIRDKDGKDIPLGTLDELYGFLLLEHHSK